MMVFKKLFSRKWIIPTILMVLGMAFLARLGVWQLDRRQQRLDFNAFVVERWRQEPFDLNVNPLPDDLKDLEYRRVEAQGRFDYSHQIVLKNQNRNDAPGVFLVTPFVMDDNRAVLVARGWAPLDQSNPQTWSQLEEPPGAPVIGIIQESQGLPDGSVSTPPPAPQLEWFRIDVPAIQGQMPYELEPAFILQLPEEGRALDKLPFREEPIRLDEGSHLGYAVQWFTFALILGFGYIMLVRYTERRALASSLAAETALSGERGEAPAMPAVEGQAIEGSEVNDAQGLPDPAQPADETAMAAQESG